MLSIEICRALTFKLLLLCIYFHTKIPLVLTTSYFYSKIYLENLSLVHIVLLHSVCCSVFHSMGRWSFLCHTSIDRHLDYLQFCATNNTAMNIPLLVLLCICVAFYVGWMKSLLIYIDSANLTYQFILSHWYNSIHVPIYYTDF